MNTIITNPPDLGFDVSVIAGDLRTSLDRLVGHVTLLAPSQSRSNILEAIREIEGISSTLDFSAYFQRMRAIDQAINAGLPKAEPVVTVDIHQDGKSIFEPKKKEKPPSPQRPKTYTKYDLAVVSDTACPYCEVPRHEPCRQVVRGGSGKITDEIAKKTHLARRQKYRGEDVTHVRATKS